MFPNRYVPTLAIRPSEMRGLEFLPREIKKLITPCILLAPWLNTKSLEDAIKRAELSFPKQDYFLDIDRNYLYSNPEKPAQQEFRRLSDPVNWAKWIEFVKKNKYAHPCIQIGNKSVTEIRQQIAAAQKLERSYCMRIERDRFPSNFDEIVSAFTAADSVDFTVILEGGWTTDALSLFAWFEGLITERLQKINPNVPIIVSCTSIPKIFTDFNGISPVPFHNRRLVRQIQKKSDRHTIIYGDWGSTRPREKGNQARRPSDRIDYPTDDMWCIARNPNEEWDFKKAAQELVHNNKIWDANSDAWGAEMIRRTATFDKGIGINTPQKNVAARVNIHLHRQALYGQSGLHEETFKGEWED